MKILFSDGGDFISFILNHVIDNFIIKRCQAPAGIETHLPSRTSRKGSTQNPSMSSLKKTTPIDFPIPSSIRTKSWKNKTNYSSMLSPGPKMRNLISLPKMFESNKKKTTLRRTIRIWKLFRPLRNMLKTSRLKARKGISGFSRKNTEGKTKDSGTRSTASPTRSTSLKHKKGMNWTPSKENV